MRSTLRVGGALAVLSALLTSCAEQAFGRRQNQNSPLVDEVDYEHALKEIDSLRRRLRSYEGERWLAGMAGHVADFKMAPAVDCAAMPMALQRAAQANGAPPKMLGSGITKRVFSVELNGVTMVAKRVDEQPIIEPVVQHPTYFVNGVKIPAAGVPMRSLVPFVATHAPVSRMGDYKLLKEAHILQALEHQWGANAIHVYGTCFFSENGDATGHDFSDGLTAFYEKGQSLRKEKDRKSAVSGEDVATATGRQLWGEKWIDMLRRLHWSSMGSIELTDVKWDQFVWLRGQVHMIDMDDVFIHPLDRNNERHNQTAFNNCRAIIAKLKGALLHFGAPDFNVRACAAGVLGVELDSAELKALR